MLAQKIKKGLGMLLVLGSLSVTGASYAYYYHYITTHCWGGYCHRVVNNYWGGDGYHYHTRWVHNW